MRIVNNSDLRVDEILFERVVELLALEEQIDGVEHKELSVTIDKQKQRNDEENVLYGQYSPGEIKIYPCRNCKEGAIVLTFLHEIIHHWLHEKHQEICSEEWTEAFCEEIAQEIFKEVGGKILPKKNCERYLIDLPARGIHRKSRPGRILSKLKQFKTEGLEECAIKQRWDT